MLLCCGGLLPAVLLLLTGLRGHKAKLLLRVLQCCDLPSPLCSRFNHSVPGKWHFVLDSQPIFRPCIMGLRWHLHWGLVKVSLRRCTLHKKV